MMEVAGAAGVPVVDADELFSRLSEHGIVGRAWLVDHIHPTIEGHQRLGEALAAQVLESQYCPVVEEPNWGELGAVICRKHLVSLGEEYFHRGKQRLEGLLLWTQGRAKKVREEVLEDVRID